MIAQRFAETGDVIMLYCECENCSFNDEFDCTLETPGIGVYGICLYFEPIIEQNNAENRP